MKDLNLITSVMGFDLECTLKDEYDQPLKTGIKSTVHIQSSLKPPTNRIIDKKWFTHFDDGLYNKVLDYRKHND